MSEVDELSALIAESLGDEQTPTCDDNTLQALRAVALQFRELKDRKTGLDHESDEIAKQLKLLELDLKNRMDALGSTSLRLDGVGLLYLQTDPYPSIHDPAGFIEWADANDLSYLAKRSVHSATARSFWKERLENGASLPPPEIADAALIKTVRMRRS
jgi:hypothetical protein